ncbi:MAG: outer-membrane lipoprotein carrier protein LolA [Acidobacteriota bacterium]|nr:outer-membrane lipoprotein carrier protein LolA [Acidobacteriota bacterium]
MKKLVTIGLVAAMLLAAIAGVSIAPPRVDAQSAGLVSSIINRMERNRRDLKSLRAQVSMTKYNAQIRDEDKFGGEVRYMPGKGRNAFVRVDWQYPQKESLAVIDGKYTLLRQRLKMAYVGDANSNRNKVGSVVGFGLNVTRQQLASNYEPPQYLGEETLWGGVRTTHLKIVPKGGARFKYAEIWVDMQGMPVQTKVIEKNDDATTVRLTDVQRNPALSTDEFKVQLGSDIKIVRG